MGQYNNMHNLLLAGQYTNMLNLLLEGQHTNKEHETRSYVDACFHKYFENFSLSKTFYKHCN